MHNINYHGDEFVPEVLLALPFIVVFILYIFAVVVSNRRHKKWSLYRTTSWIFGVICVLIAVIGPLADRSEATEKVHLLLGR
ncbi:cytochrome c oxidase assembly protein [Heyndrickxia vini]|uniref:cytochrome c oxidase assembly protein n=1 Tax=Heyndrickxia vini TaxID=1476025 RepID=UPI003CCDD337